MKQITQTTNQKSAAIARILIAVPLLAISSQHLIGIAPLEPILRGAGVPFPELNAIVGPVLQLLAGALLVSGYFARVGAALTIPAMGMATYTHLVYDWADEPPLALPLLLIALSIFVIWKGAGSWSFDLKCNKCASA
ncbi:MAG: DoxX family protein [Roseibacillus sp.]